VQTGPFRIVRSTALNAQMLELPYQNSNMSMLLLLPDVQSPDIRSTLAAINPYTIDQALGAARNTTVQVFMPKFELTSKMAPEVKSALQRMGVRRIFTSGADFGDFSRSSLFVDSVVHQAAITVDEEGTVAAAATAVVGTRIGFPQFILNRPFIFLLYETNYQVTLFAGVVNNPQAT